MSRIEAVSFVTAEAIPQMADADEVWAARHRATPPSATRRSRPTCAARERALTPGSREVEAVVSASDTHNRKNVEPRHGAVAGRHRGRSIDEAHQRGATCQVVVATAWGCPYEGDVPVERVLCGRWPGASRTGPTPSRSATPPAWRRRAGCADLVGAFRSGHPDVPLNLHFHNTRGTGLANVLAALELGVDDFDASVGGLGRLPVRARRERQHRAPRNWCTWSRTWAWAPASTWRR